MTFLEAALEVLRRERKPLPFKEISQRAIDQKLLTFVGRTPEVTMQTQLVAAVKKAPGNPFVRVKPGVFGLLRYPETPLPPEPEPIPSAVADEPAADAADAGRARRRGGRDRAFPRDDRSATETRAGGETGMSENGFDGDEAEMPEAPGARALSPGDRAAALADALTATGTDDDTDGDGDGDVGSDAGADAGDRETPGAPTSLGDEGRSAAEAGQHGGAFGAGPMSGGEAGAEGGFGRSRRRRRRRGGAGRDNGPRDGFAPGAAPQREGDPSGLATVSPGQAEDRDPGLGDANGGTPTSSENGDRPTAGAQLSDAGASRRIMTAVDAAIEILRGQSPGRGVHVRQIADAAVRRRLVHGEPNEAWRVMRAALAAEPKERLRAGQRPRLRPAGSGLFALARRPPDLDLEKSEHVFGEARRALRERTVAGLEQRLAELPPPAFEAITRVLLQREGFGPATFVKRVEGTIYVEALRGRGARPSRCLIALRSGPSAAGRRAIGELCAGIKARGQDEGLIMLAGRLADDGVAEWKQSGPQVEVADGAALAETCLRHGVGVINAQVSVDFVDADFFAELSEG